MATGRDRHDAYLAALAALGRDLARRARSKCELTGTAGSLVTIDLEGSDVEPDLEHVVLVSPHVAEHLAGRNLDEALHYLEQAVWSPEPAVRRAAVRILKQVDEPWSRDAIDNARVMDAAVEDA